MNSPLPTAFAQGSLTPPGAPAPTMKSLAQIEPRSPISSVPFTISVPGSYYLTTNLTTTVSNAIVITANGVTLDLSGFSIASTVANSANGGTAIRLKGTTNAGLRDSTIYNGHIRGGVTNNRSGVYSGSGFAYGVYSPGVDSVNTRVSGVSVSGCLQSGISVGSGNSTVLENCTVRTVGENGIEVSTIKSTVALDCGSSGILGVQASDSRGEGVVGSGIFVTTAQNCYGVIVSSVGISATTAQNCCGYTTSGIGFLANTAQNCFGYSGGAGIGISAADVAIGCRGSSNSGTGLSAFIANSCRGTSTSGTPLTATHNFNSF